MKENTINIIIDDGIYLDYKNTDREFRQNLSRKFVFSAEVYGGKTETINLLKLADYDGVKCIKFPANLSYFENCVSELGWSVGSVVDRRACPTVEGLTTTITLRDNQVEMVEKLEQVDYNAIINSATSFGKTLTSIKLTELLGTTMLFTASRVTLIENLLKDCATFNVDKNQIVEINTAWLENKIIRPIMYCTIQTLNNPDILAALKDQVGLLVADEIHLGVTSEVARQSIYSINSKYKLFLSATYENLRFNGLTEAVLSSNIIGSDENLDFKITVQELLLESCPIMQNKYYATDRYCDKKEAIFGDEYYIKAVAELIAYTAIKAERQVLVYLENTAAQEVIAKALREYGLSVGVLNSNTKKKDTKDILNTFDLGSYKVLVSGTAVAAGISLYKLSTIFDLNITLNKNNLTQLIGRLKRQNLEICSKSKLFVKITLSNLTDRKWTYDKKALEEFDYIVWNKQIKSRIDGREMIRGLKEILA